MKILLRALREIVYAIGVLLVALIAGNILYRIIGDVFSISNMDRSNDAAQGAGILFALVVLIVYIAVRLLRRRKKLQ